MDYRTETIYTQECNGTTIMVYREKGEYWEVYFKRPGFSFMMAFGLPLIHTVAEVFQIARANLPDYEDMFT